MNLRASCTCGQLKLTYSGEIKRTAICHCLACQKRTGSAFGTQMRLDAKQTVTEGRATEFVRTGDEGSKITFRFCPVCGTTLYWDIDQFPGFFIAAAGAFDDFNIPAPTYSVYEFRKPEWVVLPASILEHD